MNPSSDRRAAASATDNATASSPATAALNPAVTNEWRTAPASTAIQQHEEPPQSVTSIFFIGKCGISLFSP
jgi:hypothetical protein